GEFIINWDPKARTALSDIEVIHKDVEGAFYHMNYMLEDGSRALEVATTRPETMFGDVAVAVNPNDDRYKDLIGQNVILPIVHKPIPIVGDEHADQNLVLVWIKSLQLPIRMTSWLDNAMICHK